MLWRGNIRLKNCYGQTTRILAMCEPWRLVTWLGIQRAEYMFDLDMEVNDMRHDLPVCDLPKIYVFSTCKIIPLYPVSFPNVNSSARPHNGRYISFNETQEYRLRQCVWFLNTVCFLRSQLILLKRTLCIVCLFPILVDFFYYIICGLQAWVWLSRVATLQYTCSRISRVIPMLY